MNKNKKQFKLSEIGSMYLLSGLVAVTAICMGTWFGYQYFAGNVNSTAIIDLIREEKENQCEHERVLDGVCVESEEEVNPKLVAVMIDNHSEARPQSGLADASVVYEAPVEGNFSRYMVIYPTHAEVDKVGPVRSARPYFLDWLSEYGDAMYMHVGGSPEALGRIVDEDVNDYNEFRYGNNFWRDGNRYAPHNTYTSSNLWNKLLDKYEDQYSKINYDGWNFGEIENCIENCTDDINVSYLYISYDVVWKYNTSTAKYLRYLAGAKHKDTEGKQIEADTIIIQKVESQVIDNVGRLKIDTIGDGEAIVFRGGEKVEGVWKKESLSGRTKWFDKNGEEIIIKSGKIWIEVSNERTEVEYN
ncbi:DUF3048 domain-containing protein [Patescibacteria group bacterium]|nr:DUF3048 domain-containing protein [Patescibacteria group bacterium]MBU1895602.1 DUF3048 domain-containing protein [Patescibacteria group bacterium]